MNWTKTVTFEQPTNEHTRVCLRLEHLFQRIEQYREGDSQWHSRAIIESLLDIVNILDRPDLKNTLSKELSRLHASLLRLNNVPHIDSSKLELILDEMSIVSEQFNGLNHKLGFNLRENEFLTSIRHHLVNPAGACNFDHPYFHGWLEEPYAIRQQYVNEWLGEVTIINNVVSLILRLIRESNTPEYKTAQQGFYQMNMDAKNPCQMIRVGLAESGVIPEISVGPHRFCVRFLTTDFQSRPQQNINEIIFKLTCCVI